MTVAATDGSKAYEGWRSPTPQDTPLTENAALPDPGSATTKFKSNGHGLTNAHANGHGLASDAGVTAGIRSSTGSDTLTNQDQHQQNQRLPNGKPSGNGRVVGNGNLAAADKGEGYKNLHPQLHYPSFQSPCEHSADGDMHSHAVDLLSISRTSPPPPRDIHPNHPLYRSPSSTPYGPGPAAGVAASVPTHAHSFLTATRPPSAGQHNASTAAQSGGSQSQSNLQAPRAARRMSSSTSHSRGKSGFLGTPQPVPTKDVRPAAVTHAASFNGVNPPNARRLSNAAGAPQMYDFSKTDRPSQAVPGSSSMGPRAVSTPAGVAASLPVRGFLHDRALAQQQQQQKPATEDMELDMQFGGSDDDDRAGSGRSGSQDIEMDVDEDTGEIITQALGTGSGGIKGRRKGETFDCEFCGKTYRHPSCLSKHRWEHSPHWQNGGTANMSKHQQVQSLEAAAILALGQSLPKDKSLWPSVVSNASSFNGQLQRRNSRDPSSLRSPSSSVLAPITPSSLREPSSLGAMSERVGKERKSSPGSDSTTSSMGAGEPYPAPNGLGLRTTGQPLPPQRLHPGMTQRAPSFNQHRRASRTPSFSNSPGHPNSLPDMAGLHFQSSSGAGVSPIPNRGIPLSLQSRAGMIGGGMFGKAVNTVVPSSSVRSGAADLPEEDDDEDDADDFDDGGDHDRAKGSSEEAEEARKAREGEEWGMAEEMEL